MGDKNKIDSVVDEIKESKYVNKAVDSIKPLLKIVVGISVVLFLLLIVGVMTGKIK